MATTRARTIRSFDYVNSPYDRVRAILTTDALAICHSATRGASSRTKSVAAALRVELGGIEIAKEIELAVREISERKKGTTPTTRLEVKWKAASTPGMFPVMNGELQLYPLTPTETQLDFSGRYEPPLGWLGIAVDTVAGRRIAEASVHRFVAEVAQYLRTELNRTPSVSL
jgi:hypothetical protein